MKKLISLALVLLLILSALTGCGGTDAAGTTGTTGTTDAAGTETVSGTDGTGKTESAASASSGGIESVKTIGDAMIMRDGTDDQASTYERYYVYAFSLNGTLYRVHAQIPEEVKTQLDALDFFDPDYETKRDELLAPLPIEKMDNLSEMLPSQEELDQLIGKTGEDLLNDGWEPWGFSLYDMQFTMQKGMFQYSFTFEGSYDGPDELPEDFDEYEYVKPLVVKSVRYFGFGNATDVEEYFEW